MRKRSLSFFIFLSLSFTLVDTAHAAWVWSPEAGKFINPDETVQETPQKQYDYAQEFYKKKNLKEAADQFRLLLRKYPGSQVAPESQFRLGTIYEEMGDYYRAFRAYRDLLARYPQSERVAEAVEREFRIGNLFFSGRKAKVMGLSILPSGPRAIEVFKHIAESAPYSDYGDKAQFQLGLTYKKANQFNEAIQAFQALIDQHPQSPFIPQARYQLADTAYLQSVVATRDQRVMDQAAQEIDRFLTHYPDSTVSEKATKLRQEIDEKNAEKNYRIALFYEKENYLDSAFIYYRDVAARYAHTVWGKKASERLRALERPAEFLKSQESEAALQKEKLVTELRAVSNSDPARKKQLEEQVKGVEKQAKEIKKSKPETIKRRRAALELKERLLKEKWKALRKKQKFYAKNPSEDLAAAFKRWEASLHKEESDLAREKMQIKEWGTSLGVKPSPLTEWVPFGKEPPSPVEQVRQAEAKRLRELSRKENDLVRDKEKLYRKYEKILARAGSQNLPSDPGYEEKRQKLEMASLQIEELENQLHEKQAVYQQNYAGPAYYTPPGALQAVLKTPGKMLGSVERLKPFESAPHKEWRRKSPQELEAIQENWQEKISEQQKLVETISQAFNDELSRAEEKRLTANVDEPGADATTLRRAIKQLEREIRGRYNEIQDRNERKNQLLEELERTMHEGKQKNPVAKIAAPARGVYGLGKAFIFGLPERDIKLTQEAQKVPAGEENQDRIRSLKEEIELESLLIDARNQEIERLKRELEALRARTSLAKNAPARPILVKAPYVFIREAVVSANRLIPKKDRHEKLIGQLNKETARLEEFKKEQSEIETLLKIKETKTGTAKSPASAFPKQSFPQSPATPLPDQKTLRDEIDTLEKRLELLQADYELERETIEKTRWTRIAAGRKKIPVKKLRKTEESLTRLIQAEKKIQEEERALLFKKEALAQQFLANPASQPLAKELSLEKKQIAARINEIEKRETALGEEIKRLHPQNLPPS